MARERPLAVRRACRPAHAPPTCPKAGGHGGTGGTRRGGCSPPPSCCAAGGRGGTGGTLRRHWVSAVPLHVHGRGTTGDSPAVPTSSVAVVPLFAERGGQLGDAAGRAGMMSHLSHRVPLRASARPCAGRHVRQAASGRSRAIRWWCRRETGRRSRSRLLGATGSRLVLARWRRTTSAAGLRRASRPPETRLQTEPFGAACQGALWSSEHRRLRRVPCWPLARTPAGIDQIRM